MEDVKLYDERGRHQRMVFEDNYGGVDYQKVLLHSNRWDIYMNGKENIIECEYMVEVVGSEGKKVLWEVVDNHVVEY